MLQLHRLQICCVFAAYCPYGCRLCVCYALSMSLSVDIIVPNESETEILTEIAVDNEVNIERATRFFHEKGIPDCIITMGVRGVVWSEENGITTYPACKVKAVDSTAAGDSFVGALALQMAQKRHLAESIHFCNAVGALTVTKKGTQISLPTINEVTAFLAQM